MKFLLSVLMVLGCNSVDAVRNTNIDYSNRSGKILAFNREHNKSFLRSFVENVQGLGKKTASCFTHLMKEKWKCGIFVKSAAIITLFGMAAYKVYNKGPLSDLLEYDGPADLIPANGYINYPKSPTYCTEDNMYTSASCSLDRVLQPFLRKNPCETVEGENVFAVFANCPEHQKLIYNHIKSNPDLFNKKFNKNNS